jgi:hypothetical protein
VRPETPPNSDVQPLKGRLILNDLRYR